LADIVHRTSKANVEFQVLAGSAGFLYPALSIGTYACIYGIYCIYVNTPLGYINTVLLADMTE